MSKHIEISEKVHIKLTKIGKKGETYNAIIERIINESHM